MWKKEKKEEIMAKQKKLNSGWLIVIGLVLLYAINNGLIPGFQSVFDEGTLCSIPSGGGDCVYELYIPKNSKLSDGNLELGFESIESNTISYSGQPVLGSFIVDDPTDNWKRTYSISYPGLTDTVLSTISSGQFDMTVHGSGKGDQDSSPDFSVVISLISEDGSESEIIGGWKIEGDNSAGDYSCSLDEYDAVNKRWVNYFYDDQGYGSCEYDYTFNINFVDVSLSSLPNLEIKSLNNYGGSGSITSGPTLSFSKVDYSIEEKISSYDLHLGATLVENNREVNSDTLNSASFPNLINDYCNRDKSSSECIVPLVFTSSSGGNIYVLDTFIKINTGNNGDDPNPYTVWLLLGVGVAVLGVIYYFIKRRKR